MDNFKILRNGEYDVKENIKMKARNKLNETTKDVISILWKVNDSFESSRR